jgi:hypothetical protein
MRQCSGRGRLGIRMNNSCLTSYSERYKFNKMTPIDWLEHSVIGFRDLPDEDRQAIYHFALLWSLFEAKALNTHATANAILALVQERGAQGRVDPAAFAPSLRHFRDRYVQDGEFTAHFDGLHLRKNDNPALVKLVLQNKDDASVDAIAALLIIVYRLRNNLFHGIKWAYGLRNQRANFSAANDALMYAFVQLVDQ